MNRRKSKLLLFCGLIVIASHIELGLSSAAFGEIVSIITDTTWRGIGPLGNQEGTPITSVGLDWEAGNLGWNSSPTYDDAGWNFCIHNREFPYIWVDGPYTEGSTPSYYRKLFELPGTPTSGLLSFGCDDDAIIYINGQLAFSDIDGVSTDMFDIDVTSLLKQGENLIAVKAHDSYGYQESFKIYLEIEIGEPPVASFKSLSVIELGQPWEESKEETVEERHMAGGVIRFDPSESYHPDPDREIQSYNWDFDGGEQIQLLHADPLKPNVIFKEARVYAVTLVVVDDMGVESEPYTENLDLSLKEGDLIFLRTAGYARIFDIVLNYWTHVGIYVGDQMMVEAIKSSNDRSHRPGVVVTPLSGWSWPSETYAVAVHSLTEDNDIIREVVAFVRGKIGQRYDTASIFRNQKQLDKPGYYCSELIWAAYYKASGGTIDLSLPDDPGCVSPDDIYHITINLRKSSHKEYFP